MEEVSDMVVHFRAYQLIQHIVFKYDLKSYEDFTCKYMRALAESMDYFRAKEIVDEFKGEKNEN